MLPYVACVLLAGVAVVDATNCVKQQAEWTKVRRASPDHAHRLTVGLTQRNLDLLEKTFWEVSDPDHETYGQHWNDAKIVEHFAPSVETRKAVDAWFLEHGCKDPEYVLHQDYATCTFNVGAVEKMFDVELHHHLHEESGTEVVRSPMKHTLPAHMTKHINFVSGVSNLPIIRSTSKAGASAEGPARHLMGATTTTPAPTTGTTTVAAGTTAPATGTTAAGTTAAGTTGAPIVPTTTAPAPVTPTLAIYVVAARASGGNGTDFSPAGANAMFGQVAAKVHLNACPGTPGGAIKNFARPCNISSITAVLKPAIAAEKEGSITMHFDASDLKCAAAPASGQLPTTDALCSFTIGNETGAIPDYVAYTLEVTASFEGGATLNGAMPTNPTSFTKPFTIVSTPPVVPQTIWKMYNITLPPSVEAPKTTQAVGEFESQFYSKSDLTSFFQLAGYTLEESQALTDGVKLVGSDEGPPGGEANLDIQYMMGVAPYIPTTFWSIKAHGTIEIDDILQWAVAQNNDPTRPDVTSLSYGMTASHVNECLGEGYIERSYVEFKKLALAGVTIIIACGDTGTGDLGPPPMSQASCEEHNNPDWPSSSPYVVAVGSTYFTPVSSQDCLDTTDCTKNPPLPANGIPGQAHVDMYGGLFWTGGGGFANDQELPSYQSKTVPAYVAGLNKTATPSSWFTGTNRGYPDFATVGHNLMVVLNGTTIPIDGTSASAPIFGAIVALLNEKRAEQGWSKLGFLNPTFYKIFDEQPNAFFDVTVGNAGSGSYGFDPLACPHGFPATKGWDAATGLGSPNFGVLADVLLSEAYKALDNTGDVSTAKQTICPDDCNGHGQCVDEYWQESPAATCHCDAGYSGDACAEGGPGSNVLWVAAPLFGAAILASVGIILYAKRKSTGTGRGSDYQESLLPGDDDEQSRRRFSSINA